VKLSVVTAETIFAPDISANIEDGVLYTVDGLKIQICMTKRHIFKGFDRTKEEIV
jgi:hypothetical protein